MAAGGLQAPGQCPPVALLNSFIIMLSEYKYKSLKLSTTDLLVLASMKNAAKCDK